MADRSQLAARLVHRRGMLSGIIVSLGLFSLGLWALSGAGAEEQTAPSGAAMPAPKVTVSHPAVRSIIEWDEYSGRFRAVDSVEIRARVPGYLTEIAFENGQKVAAGDLLFRIDQRPFKAALAEAEADLMAAKARYETAKKEVARGEELVKTAAISREVLDRRVRDAQVTQADVKAAEASVQSARLDLDYTELRAPVSGVVSDYRVSVGNLVTADNTVLTTVVSHDPIYFEFTISEADYLRYARADRVGRPIPVGIRLMDEDDFAHEATVSFIDNQLDPATGTMRVRALVENAHGLFRPQMFARVRVAATDRHDALLVEEGAVLTDQSAQFVWALTDDNSVVQKPVVPGPLIEGWRVIREGLNAEDRVVIKGIQFVSPGQYVDPVMETGSPLPGRALFSNPSVREG